MSRDERFTKTPDLAALSIEDNYEEYLDEECGYAYDFADRVTPEDVAMQDSILAASAAQLRALDDAAPEPANGLHLWMRARAWERLGDSARYFDLCAQLLDAGPEHPLLIYPEISRRVARHHAARAQLGAAQARLGTHLERWPQDLQAEQLRAVVDFLQRRADTGPPEDADAALRAFASRFPEDAEIRYEIAEDLWHFGSFEAARAWLKEARDVATQHDLTTLVDIELLHARFARSESTP